MKAILWGILLLPFLACNKDANPVKKVDPAPPPPTTGYFKDVIQVSDTDTALSIIVIGDWGKEGEGLQDVSMQMAEVAEYLNVSFILAAGDNIYENGVDSIDDPAWDVYTENFNQPSLQIPWYVCAGNHDHYGNVQVEVDYTDVDDRWTMPNFFFTFKKAINGDGDSLGIVIFDSERLQLNPDELGQLQWIDSVSTQLESPWKIMMGHHPLYSYGYHGSNPTMQTLIEDILYDNHYDLYVAGHDHDMQHIQTTGYTDFFIAGSTGKIRPTESGPLSLFSLSEYGFLTLRLSKHKLECYFVTRTGDVVYSYKKEK
jgi:hypothetical protein